MKHTQSLPEPSADALQHSQKLIERICEEITKNNGSITFRRYMEMALYEPALGYYVAGTHKIGAEGDFVTAPEISTLFSKCIANQCADISAQASLQKGQKRGMCALTSLNKDILELGAGSGIMATDILLELEKLKQLPNNYYILDLSPDLKQRQQETLEKYAPHLLKHVQWLNQLPKNFNGIIIGNEVLDAMPVDVFTQHNDTVYEHHIIWEDDQLREQLKPANKELHEQVLSLKIPNEATPYTSEINPNLPAWFESISKSLDSGVILLIDYGYTRSDYYLHERNKGTLICHFQHLVNEAPLHYPGLQDITASVDFTAIAEAADDAGLNVSGYTTQASFLANSGLEEYFIDILAKHPEDQYKLAQQVRTLSLPSEMGERFKCIALSKNFNKELDGFKTMNLLHKL